MGSLDAGQFKPVEVIMHPIPKGRAPEDGSDPILYSEAPIALSGDDRAFIQRRLRHSLGGYARPVAEEVDGSSKLPELIKELLVSSDKLVDHSCAVARQLHVDQKWMSSGGLVMTVIGQLNGTKCVVIAKMEHQEGMRVEQTKDKDGRRTYRAEHLRDLILGDGTRVFKVGLFTRTTEGDLDGYVVDDQQLQGTVANYFIQFLGCEFKQQSDVQTETFLTVAQKFVDQRTKDAPEKNARYQIALLSELQSKSAAIQPEKFALEHLDEEDQDLFVQRMRDAGLSSKSFRKDTTLVATKIRRMRIRTSRGADVFAPPEMYEDGSLHVDNVDGGVSRITLRDKVEKITGANGKKSED